MRFLFCKIYCKSLGWSPFAFSSIACSLYLQFLVTSLSGERVKSWQYNCRWAAKGQNFSAYRIQWHILEWKSVNWLPLYHIYMSTLAKVSSKKYVQIVREGGHIQYRNVQNYIVVSNHPIISAEKGKRGLIVMFSSSSSHAAPFPFCRISGFTVP